MDALIRLARRDSRLAAGLISGTSADGVDAAVVRVSGSGPTLSVEILFHGTAAYDDDLRARVLAAGRADAPEIANLHFDLGRFFAAALRRMVKESGIDPSEVDLVGSHGQTVWHDPPSGGKKGATLQLGDGNVLAEEYGKKGATLQLGDGNVLAEESGLVAVTDFRAADLAAGGEGAPLVPYLDWALFRDLPGTTVALNLGGIANVTVVPGRAGDGPLAAREDEDAGPRGVTGFDTGPANMVLDALAERLLPGRPSCDRDGAAASRGRVHEPLLLDLLDNRFFHTPPPKSTGRELFGASYVDEVVSKGGGLGADDLLATLTQLTARSVAEAVEMFVDPRLLPPQRVIVSGGGVHNAALMAMLAERFSPVPVEPSDTHGIPVDGKEAVLFAVLAAETVKGTPTNLPAVTGASGSRVLGKISLPPS